MSSDFPITQAVRFLREKKVDFVPHLYDYVDKGGTRESAKQLGVAEHAVVKTIVFETNEKKPLIVLMHGDRKVSTKNLARQAERKSIEPCKPEVAQRHTGYLVGGTSPFGTRKPLPVFAERSIRGLEEIYINGGRRGLLLRIRACDLEAAVELKWVDVALS